MGKIGDLWVKLGLKKDEFDKGLKESEKQVSSFGKKTGGINWKGLAAKGAAAFAVISVAAKKVWDGLKKLGEESQHLGDVMARTAAGASGAWTALKTAIASLDFTNLISNMREARRLARDLYDATDALGEIGASYAIASAEQKQRINELNLALSDTSKSEEERLAAGRELLKIYEDLEKNMTRGTKAVADATLDAAINRMGMHDLSKMTEEQIKSIRAQYIKFFKWLGTSQGQAALSAAEKVSSFRPGSKNDYYKQAADLGVGGNLAQLTLAYARRGNDKTLQAVTQSYVAAEEQRNKAVTQTMDVRRKMLRIEAQENETLSTGTGIVREETDAMEELMQKLRKMEDVKVNPFEAMEDDIEDMLERMEGLLSDYADEEFGAVLDHLQADIARVDSLNRQLSEAIASGLSGGIQELANGIMGLKEINLGSVLQALIEPLADLAVKEGEILVAQGLGVEAFKLSMKTLQGGAALAAGATLIAIGTAAKAGLQALASGGKGAAAASSYASGGYDAAQNITSELTVTVKGELRGRDIVLAGQNTINSWNR